jgi:hypothetical protein
VTDLYVFDAAYRPDLAAVKAAGGIAVNGYLTGVYSSSTTQPGQAIAAGLGFLPTYEEGASELVGATRAAGQAIGKRIAAAFQAKGLSDDGSVAVYPSVDVNVPGSSAGVCDEGWRGIRDVLGAGVSLRCYAEGAIIDHLVSASLVDGKCWLAAPTSWPGYRVDDANVCLVQQVGVYVAGTDRNHLVTDPHALGALWPANSPYGGPMTITAADLAPDALDAIAGAVWSKLLDHRSAQYRLEAINTATGQLAAAVGQLPTVDALAAAVVAALPSGPAGTLTQADVESAVRGVLAGTTLTPPAAP